MKLYLILLSILLYFNIFSQENISYLINKNSVQIDTFTFLRASVPDLFIDQVIDGRFVAIVSYDSIAVSTNDGKTWNPSTVNIQDGPMVAYHSFSFNPFNPNKGYLAAGNDLMKTIDRGLTWDSTNLFQGFYELGYVVYHPLDSNVIFMSNFRPQYNTTHLFRSMDGGNSWAIADTTTEYEKLVFNYQAVDTIYGLKMNSFITQSADTGKTWKTINNNLVIIRGNVRVLEISKSNPNVLYCGQIQTYTDYDDDKWLLATTTNRGENWERIDSTLLEIDPEGSVEDILLDQNIEGRFYISYTGGLYLTEDNGKHFQKVYSGAAGYIWSDNKNPPTIYFDSDKGLLRFIDTVTVGVKKIKNDMPSNFALEQNYPNPFNPSTIIKYSIPRSTEYYSVQQTTLKVYDILGREVTTLVNKAQQPGSYEVKWDALNKTSGVYYYQIRSGNFVKTKKMILLK
ncbi:Alkaline phosphatase [hydrothermal vent metagenome]|uniref:Alkaline phosphatase n=1 Tax=hydrothermal vent metagenome TaxID=652676 RepID=A0A3B1CJE7_9ZZZZ